MNLKTIAADALITVAENLKSERLGSCRASAKSLVIRVLMKALTDTATAKTGLCASVREARYNSRSNGEIALTVAVKNVVSCSLDFRVSFEIRPREGYGKEVFLKSLRVEEPYSKEVYLQDLSQLIDAEKEKDALFELARKEAKAAEKAALAKEFEGVKTETIRTLEAAIEAVRSNGEISYRMISDASYRYHNSFQAKFS